MPITSRRPHSRPQIARRTAPLLPLYRRGRIPDQRRDQVRQSHRARRPARADGVGSGEGLARTSQPRGGRVPASHRPGAGRSRSAAGGRATRPPDHDASARHRSPHRLLYRRLHRQDRVRTADRGLKLRMSHLQQQQQAAVEAINAERELSLLISRLEDFSAKVSQGLDRLDCPACARSSTPSFAESRSIATASRSSSGPTGASARTGPNRPSRGSAQRTRSLPTLSNPLSIC